MQTTSWIFVFILIPVLQGTILFRRQNKKCEAVVMCPQFCLKIKDGCYVCQCGESINTYMEGAIQNMKHDYDPIYQTGSKMVNLNMGSNAVPDEQNSGLQKSQWMNMAAYGGAVFGGPMMGGAGGGAGTLSQPIGQSGHYLEPDFKEFYRPVGMSLPGRCPQMDYACPGRCWKTDGFSGCFRCDCGDKSSTISTTQPITQAPSGGQKTTDVPSTAQERSTEPTTSTPTVTSSTVTPIRETTSQSIDLHHIKGNIATTTSAAGLPTNNNSTSNESGKNVTSEQTTMTLNQLTSLLNGNAGVSPNSNPASNQGGPAAIDGGLADLTGAELFKILIGGIKEHKSLSEVLYTLAQKVNPSLPEEKVEGQGQTQNVSLSTNQGVVLITEPNVASNHTQPGESRLSDVMTTEGPTEALPLGGQVTSQGIPQAKQPEGCLDLGTACPPKCHVTDPVTKCPVCSCPDRQNETSPLTMHARCVPLDGNCPSECITLDGDLCPICVCKHRQTDKVSTDTPSSTTPPTNAVCRITEEIRNCASSCLKLDSSFCPVCACSSDVSSETPKPPHKEKICPSVERGCPQKCLTFDENYCAYCFCDN